MKKWNPRNGAAAILSLLLPVLLAGGPIDPRNPPEGRFTDDWAEIHMAGGKVGYAHTSMTREGREVRTEVVTRLKIGRADQPVQIEGIQGTTELVDGTPLSFVSEMNASVMKTSMRGTIRDGKVTIVSSQYGIDQTQTFDFPAGALMTWGMFRDGLLRSDKPGTEYTVKAYTPELRMDGPIEAITRIGAWETFEHEGRKQRGQKVSITMQAPIGSIELLSWVDESRTPIKAEIPMPGVGNITMITTTQERALRDFVPPEVFMRTVIKAGRALDPKTIESIRYRLRSTNRDTGVGEIPTTNAQKPSYPGDGSVELTVARRRHVAVEHPGSPLSAERLKEFLEPNLMINTRDEKLMELAKEAGGGEKDLYKLADRLRKFVTEYVTSKSLNIGFATASEVARNREGDCSEHGVLLAALGRMNGLPSRVAVGLAYVPTFGGEKDVFGYHLWTQFYMNGEWLDVDAALRETECSPIRIALATSSLKNTGLADLSLPLISKLGALDIEILEVKERAEGK